MGAQDYIVVVVAVVVAIVVVQRVWRFFTCGNQHCSCCDKECPKRKE